MKNPRPIHLTPTKDVESAGWAAEARDKDGHLISTVAWHDFISTNENLKTLSDFIAEYEGDCTVQVFTANIKI